MNMKCNEGDTDRIIRMLGGIFVMGLGIAYHTWWGALGVIPLITGATGWCPVYGIFKISTCKPSA